MTTTVTMLIGDVRDVMTQLPDNAFDLLATSPPFLALRSYLPADHPDKHREIGSEPTPAAFLDTLYGLTADWGRLLPEWASICVELGDTMSGSGGAGGDYNADGLREGQPKFRQKSADGDQGRPRYAPGGGPLNRGGGVVPFNGGPGWPLAKSMCILPHLYTAGLAYGHNPLTGVTHPAGQWRVRNVICWARPNPPVGSLGKRNPHTRTGDYKFRPATSYITVACRGTGRYFDLNAVRVEHTSDHKNGEAVGNHKGGQNGYSGAGRDIRTRVINPAGAPPLDWHTDHLDGDWLWKLATAPYRGAHYATYPVALPARLILAMCPEWVCNGCGHAVEYHRDERSGTRHLLGMRQGVQAGPPQSSTKDVRGSVSESQVCASAAEHPGLRHVGERTQAAVAPGPSNGAQDGLRDGASAGDGRTPGSHADQGRGRPPHQRDQDRQQDREPSTADGVRAQPHHPSHDQTNGRVPVLPGDPRDEWACIHCGSTSRRVGRVLDCFGGSGTTAVAATLNGRDATLIDLDERNVDLVDRRLRENVRVLDRTDDGNRITWTVEVVSATELEHDAAGQLGLFA